MEELIQLAKEWGLSVDEVIFEIEALDDTMAGSIVE